jgi:hypothetical protein
MAMDRMWAQSKTLTEGGGGPLGKIPLVSTSGFWNKGEDLL